MMKKLFFTLALVLSFSAVVVAQGITPSEMAKKEVLSNTAAWQLDAAQAEQIVLITATYYEEFFALKAEKNLDAKTFEERKLAIGNRYNQAVLPLLRPKQVIYFRKK